MFALHSARLAMHRRHDPAVEAGDAGYMMIYVLMVISIITVLVGGTLVVTSSNVVPTVQNVYDQAARAAAQAGINAFVAAADTYCTNANSTVNNCANQLTSNLQQPNFSGVVSFYSGSGYTAKYAWTWAKDPANKYFRVTSTGTVNQGGISASKTLIADVGGGATANPTNYGLIVGFETESPTAVLWQWQNREIAFDATGVANAGVPIKNNSVTWSGASPGAAAGKVAVCNATINQNGGRGNNPPRGAPNPYVDFTEDTIQGNHYTDYQPCQTSWGHLTELLAPVNPADGPGGYTSGDAMLLSNSYPGGTGPLFDQQAYTKYSYDASLDAGVCGTAAGQLYRSFSLLCAGYPVEVGGSPSPSSTYPSVLPAGSVTPPSLLVTIPASACLYNGPTRVKLNGDGTATITSPQTTAAWVAASASGHPAQCYAGANGLGMALQSISLTAPSAISILSVQNDGNAPPVTPAAAHGGSGWPVTGQYHGATPSTSNSLFSVSSGATGSSTATTYTGTVADTPYTPAVGDNPSIKTDTSWTPQWTSFTTGTSCSTSTLTTDLKFFNCKQSPVSGYSATEYSTIKSAVQAALTSAPASYNTIASLQTYLNTLLAAGNSSDANNANPTNHDNTSHRWQVAVAQDATTTDGCTPASNVAGTTTNTTVGAPSSDTFFSNVAGNIAVTPSTTTTCLTATATVQVPTCTVLNLLGTLCIGSWVWGNGTAVLGGGLAVPQFKVTTTNKTIVTTTATRAALSSFPYMDDVTQYSIGSGGTFGTGGPGDLYVEGTNPTTLALHAQDDVIVTGTLAPTGGLVDAQTPVMNPTAALEVIGQNDVRVYHPVKCVITDLTLNSPVDTSPGYCPDDITGLYSGVPANGARPDQQYTNMRQDLANLTINGVVYAMGNAPQSITCPEPPGGSGACGGDFIVDNYNRGDSIGTASLGYVTVIGTLSMQHHAPLGEEWETADVSGLTSRPYSGYQFADRYQNVSALLAANSSVNGLVPSGGTTPNPWHIISTSVGTP